MVLEIVNEPVISQTQFDILIEYGPQLATKLTAWFNDIRLTGSNDVVSMVESAQDTSSGYVKSWDIWFAGGGNGTTTTFGTKMARIASTRQVDNSISVKVNIYEGSVTFKQPTQTIVYQYYTLTPPYIGRRNCTLTTASRDEPREVNEEETKWLEAYLHDSMQAERQRGV